MSTTVMKKPPALANGSAANVVADVRTNPVAQAFWLLRLGFTLAPILFGLDKFAHVLVDWDRYLAPSASSRSSPVSSWPFGRASAATWSPPGSAGSSSTC